MGHLVDHDRVCLQKGTFHGPCDVLIVADQTLLEQNTEQTDLPANWAFLAVQLKDMAALVAESGTNRSNKQ